MAWDAPATTREEKVEGGGANGETLAWIFCCVWTVFYVGSLYLVPSGIRALPRDDARQVKARFVCVAVVSTIAVCSLPTLMGLFPADPNGTSSSGGVDGGGNGGDGFRAIPAYLGVRYHGVIAALILPLALTMFLFLGPLVVLSLYAWEATTNSIGDFGRLSPLEKPVSFLHALREQPIDRSGAREHAWGAFRGLVFGPISEEVVFRGCFMALLFRARASPTRVVCLSPLVFGLAHFHHMRDKRRLGMSWLSAIQMTLFQIAYTSLFGTYVAFIHLRTGHLVAPILCHMFCNFMGLPDLSFTSKPGTAQSTALSCLYPRRNLLKAAYMVGIAMFVLLLVPLTEPYLYHR